MVVGELIFSIALIFPFNYTNFQAYMVDLAMLVLQ